MRAILGAALLGVWVTAAHAAFPDRPITVIVPYVAGGGADIAARNLQPSLEAALGEGARLVIANKGGAGGAIGFAQIAEAKPDGYTIGIITTPNIVTIPLERKTSFTWQSFDLIGNIVDDPGTLAVHAESPLKTMVDLIAKAKADPGSISVGTTGVGSYSNIALLAFERMAGLKITQVPFSGSSAIRGGLIQRDISAGAMTIGEMRQFIAGGSPVRLLAQFTATRDPAAADVPTLKEQGYDLVASSMRGLAAPKGLPADVREKLVGAVARAIADPDFKMRSERAFAPVRFLAPDAFAAELRTLDERYRRIWSETPWSQ
jgi:tripartite-type tricarboxylate transporter receptor subunit TctC